MSSETTNNICTLHDLLINEFSVSRTDHSI